MRSTLFAAVFAALAFGTAQADFIPLDTPNAQATKFSENGDYLVTFMYAQGGTRWSRATGMEEMIPGMYALNGINNAGTVSGSAPVDGGYDNGGHDLPALVPLGAGAPTILPLPADTQNAEAYDVSDDGSVIGLTWSDDYSVARAYYYSSATQGVVALPVSDASTASRGNSISADGTVIAGWNDDPDSGFRRGVVWHDLTPVYPAVTIDGVSYSVGEASAVSGNGHWVVGNQYPTSDFSEAAWRYNVQTGELTPIPGIPFAFGVSDDGKTVVGASGFFDFPARAAYIWTEQYGSQLLTDYMDARAIAYPSDWGFSGGLTGLSGDGTMAAGWTIDSPNGMQSFIVTGLDAPTDAIFANGFDGPPPVKDPGFEASQFDNTNPNWESGNTHPDATGVFYNYGAAHNGQYYAEFGGWGDGEPEEQYFSQDVVMQSVGPAYLNFWRYIPMLPDNGTVTISMDGNVLQTVDFSTYFDTDEDYVPQTIDVSSYADGQTHALKFAFSYAAGSTDGAILFDDVSIDMTRLVDQALAPSKPRHLDAATLSIPAHRPQG